MASVPRFDCKYTAVNVYVYDCGDKRRKSGDEHLSKPFAN